MTQQNKIQLFEQKKVRTLWNEDAENGTSLLWM